MSNKITPKEALYGFAGWLTTRRMSATFGGSHNSGPACDALKEFTTFNPGVGEITDAWPKVFVYPVTTYFSPSSRFYEWEVKTFHLPWIRLKKLWARCVR